MSYVLALEAIGDDAVHRNREAVSFFADLGVPPRWVDAKPLRPWVAKLVAPDPDWGFEREFLRGKRSYERANSVGSRGVMVYYRLLPGCVYEVFSRPTWGATDQYFCRVESGELVRMTREEVGRWLQNAD